MLTGSRLEGLPGAGGVAALVVDLRGCASLVDALQEECRSVIVDGLDPVPEDAPAAAGLQTPFPLAWTRVTQACERAEVVRSALDLAARLETVAPHGCGTQLDLESGLWQAGWPTREAFAVTRFDWDPRQGDVPSDPTFHRRRAELARDDGTVEIVRRLRRAYDPAGILNRGRLEHEA